MGRKNLNKVYDDVDEYKKAVLSEYIKSSDIMKEITLPESVYKYRKFDIQYLKESLDGNVFFSNPIDMNVNDPYDCKLEFDTREILKTIFPGISRGYCRKHPEVLDKLEKYKKSLQGALRVGCFTTCDCSKIEMWDNRYFGDNHRGYCIKYKVGSTHFYPHTIIFLKILYDDCGFDATNAMKNFVEWVKLLDNGMKDDQNYKMRTVKLVCLGYNHALFKPEKYQNEKEWRIIIPNNRYLEYFGEENVYTKDFSPLMQAIYLGSEFRNSDKSGEMFEYALKVCRRLHIPLYIMQRNGEKMEEKIAYNPNEE